MDQITKTTDVMTSVTSNPDEVKANDKVRPPSSRIHTTQLFFHFEKKLNDHISTTHKAIRFTLCMYIDHALGLYNDDAWDMRLDTYFRREGH